MLKTLLKKIIQGLLYLLDKDHRTPNVIINDYKKFTHIVPCEFKSDFGDAISVMRTIPYATWKLTTPNHTLYAADDHRIVDSDFNLCYIKDVRVGDKIITNHGIEEVISCESLNIDTHMYCINTNNITSKYNHLYFTNGILSHNTTCAAAFLLWKALFYPDTKILIVANKYVQALEIMDRIRFAYEEMPNWIKAGVTEYNKGSIIFDNGSAIKARATSPDAGRGFSATYVYCVDGDSVVTIRDKNTGDIKTLTLERLTKYLSED